MSLLFYLRCITYRGFNMELRRVQRTGGGTFFVCLPKRWAEQNGLNRGSIVSISEAMNGRLVVDAKYGTEPQPQLAVIWPTPFLDREIVGKYLLGYDIIRVEAKERITPDDRELIKQASSKLIGLEIVEENYSMIMMQCLLEPSAFPPEKILQREYSISSSMHRDAVTAFIEGDTHLAKNVMARDDEVNRLYFLLVRILRTIVRNPSLSDKLAIPPIECLDYRLASSLVEAIGDQSRQIAHNAINLPKKIGKDTSQIIQRFHIKVYEAHEIALNALFSRDVSTAESVRARQETISKTLIEVQDSARNQPVEIVPPTLDTASSLNRIYDCSVDLADLVMPKLT
jgi:phosphate uptake regulator